MSCGATRTAPSQHAIRPAASSKIESAVSAPIHRPKAIDTMMSGALLRVGSREVGDFGPAPRPHRSLPLGPERLNTRLVPSA